MTGNDDANHVGAVRWPYRAASPRVTHAFRHPGIGARFADWNRTQDFPIAELKFRAYRSQRQIKLEIPARKILRQLLADGLDMPMLSRNNTLGQALAQNRQLAFEGATIAKLE